jgi:hypothetical protein
VLLNGIRVQTIKVPIYMQSASLHCTLCDWPCNAKKTRKEASLEIKSRSAAAGEYRDIPNSRVL